MGKRGVRSWVDEVAGLAEDPASLSVQQAQDLLKGVRAVYRVVMLDAGHDAREVRKLAAKPRDAGRRSAPWRAFSKRVAGRPQDGADGNRQKRWFLSYTQKLWMRVMREAAYLPG
jgi:hypothetical protein